MWTFVQHTAGHGGERRGRGRGGRILPRGINRRGYWRGKGKTGIQGQRWGCGGALTAAELMLADCWSPLLLKLPLHKSKGAKQSFGTRHPSCSNPVLAAPLLVVDDETGSTWVLRWRRVSHSLSTPCPHSLPALPARLHAHILTKNQKREPSSHARRRTPRPWLAGSQACCCGALWTTSHFTQQALSTSRLGKSRRGSCLHS